MANPYYSRVFDVTPGNKVLSQAIEDEFTRLQSSFDGVQSAISAAQNYSAAPAFDSSATYTNNFVVISNVDKQLYRRNSAGQSSTDPANDAANWTRVVIGLIRSVVSSSTVTAYNGYDYHLTGVACAVTAPAAVDGAHFAVTPANGLTTNTIDFGAATAKGPVSETTGVVTLNLGLRMEFIYSSTISKWVSL